MKLISQTFEILGAPRTFYEAWDFVAMAARNCYQSQKTNPKETERHFCERLLLKNDNPEANHMTPFEFGIVYLKVPRSQDEVCNGYTDNPYSRVVYDKQFCYVTTNLRVIYEHEWEADLTYAVSRTEKHKKAYIFKLVTSRAVMCELTRHRSLSFCIESTRYCNYSKEKFNNELTFIQPCWYGGHNYSSQVVIYKHFRKVEEKYFQLLSLGWTPQQAAIILPNDLKTTIMMCGYEDSLQHMFNLRAEEISGPVHPQMAELMKPLYEAYKNYDSSETKN